MDRSNYLVEGVSGTGKTSVCEELQRRGPHAVHGDRVLAYQGDPATGAAVGKQAHEHHIWDVEKVRALIANRDTAQTFFCGGSTRGQEMSGAVHQRNVSSSSGCRTGEHPSRLARRCNAAAGRVVDAILELAI